jgi:hypothetical protein
VSESKATGRVSAPGERTLKLNLDGFAWEALEQERLRLGVSLEELVSFSVLYYLADSDSGRLARRITASPYLDPPP